MAEIMQVKNDSSDAAPSGMASLVGGIIEDTQRLVRQEVALARSEAQEAWDKAKMSAALLAAALAVCVPSGVLLGFMLVRLLEQVLPYEWACFGIVGGSFALVGGILIYGGMTRFHQVRLVPHQTVETLQQDVRAATTALTPAGRP